MTKKNAELTYQEMAQELDDILLELQEDGLDVDSAIRQYERGLELIKMLESYLNEAENKVVELKARFDG